MSKIANEFREAIIDGAMGMFGDERKPEWSHKPHKFLTVETFVLRLKDNYSAGSVVITYENATDTEPKKIQQVNLVYLEPKENRGEMYGALVAGDSINHPLTIASQKKMIEEGQAFMKTKYGMETTVDKKRTDKVNLYEIHRDATLKGIVRIHKYNKVDKHAHTGDWVYYHDAKTGDSQVIFSPFDISTLDSTAISETIRKLA